MTAIVIDELIYRRLINLVIANGVAVAITSSLLVVMVFMVRLAVVATT